MTSTNPTVLITEPFAAQSFSAVRQTAADSHTLALIASSLVAATIIAFLAMVLTAWPAKASEPIRMAALPSALIQSETAMAAPARPAPLAGNIQTASLSSTPMPLAVNCADELAAIETELNRTLAKAEALDGQDMALQCPAFRSHMAALSTATALASRCMSGDARRLKVGFLRQSAAEWRGVVANGCR
ncbi:hypothetical protein E8L99_20995 [Phreatobacter aquaticus]|uniref:Uncharacterized protein n=1 Tax=Phreatobacter aquaticus TaxID=2570229 RepID=A0A4D7QR33_9HYPH|nr:hypothetical protein [Phreatobacter aquaticus]QCK88056.1 hypothetical protein E8L99_20995 [Phreatobacter aquaticus]